MVIDLHTRPFLSISVFANSIYNYDIANYAVPLFYACTGFFIAINSMSKSDFVQSIKRRIQKTTVVYVWCTVLYFPLTLYGWTANGKNVAYNILDFIRNFFFVGENYYSWTLWYLNGLIFALLIVLWGIQKADIKQLFVISAFLYVIGLLLQTETVYQGAFPQFINTAIRLYFKIFHTTRNGLFRSFAFVMVGMMIGKQVQQDKLRVNSLQKAVVLIAYALKVPLSVFGGGTIQNSVCQMLDLPTMYVLFALVIIQASRFNKINKRTALLFRSLSGNIYYIHMYFVALCALILMSEDTYNNFFSFFVVAVLSTLLGAGMIFIMEKNQAKGVEIGKSWY